MRKYALYSIIGRFYTTLAFFIAAVSSFSAYSQEMHPKDTAATEYNLCLGPNRELDRPVKALYSLEAGGAFVTSTYLSPLRYHGSAYAFSGAWTKAFNRCPERMTMRFDATVNFTNSHNPARNANIYGLTAGFGWGLGARWSPAPRWSLGVGGMADVYGGALLSSRNGNNPVTALFRFGLAANGFAAYAFRLGRLPVIIADEVKLPLLNGFFCPEYGESYYEIYLGNTHGLAHFGWPGNAPAVNNLLSIRMDFGRTAMLVGYRLDVNTFKANHLTTQTLTNALVIGVIPGGLGIKRHRPANYSYF